jgi:hypothetical protein
VANQQHEQVSAVQIWINFQDIFDNFGIFPQILSTRREISEKFQQFRAPSFTCETSKSKRPSIPLLVVSDFKIFKKNK